MRGQRPRVAPVAIEIGDLLGGGGAADVEQQAAAADGEFVRDDLGLGRKQGRPVRRLDGICVTGIERVGRKVERFSRRQHNGLRGEGATGDLADGLLQERIVGRGFGRREIECPLAGLDQRRGIAQSGARDAGIDRGQEELRKGVGIGNAVAGVRRVKYDLLPLDPDIAEMRGSGRRQPLSQAIPVVDQFDAFAIDRNQGCRVDAGRIGGADQDIVRIKRAGAVVLGAIKQIVVAISASMSCSGGRRRPSAFPVRLPPTR